MWQEALADKQGSPGFAVFAVGLLAGVLRVHPSLALSVLVVHSLEVGGGLVLFWGHLAASLMAWRMAADTEPPALSVIIS